MGADKTKHHPLNYLQWRKKYGAFHTNFPFCQRVFQPCLKVKTRPIFYHVSPLF